MRVSRERALRNRDCVIEAAARLVRERGFNGVSIAGVMAVAGLTRGGFYSSFASKDDLATQATERAATTMSATLRAGLAISPHEAFRALVEHYVSRKHRDNPGFGCILPALAADAARYDIPGLRAVFTAVIQEYLDQLSKLAPTMPDASRRRHPSAILSEMVGGVLLSRVLMNDGMADALIAEVVNDLADAKLPSIAGDD